MAVVSTTSEVAVINGVGDSLRAAYPGRTSFRVKAVVWQFTGATPPATLALEDNATNVILRLSSQVAADTIMFEFPDRAFDDVEIDAISLGTVYIFLR